MVYKCKSPNSGMYYDCKLCLHNVNTELYENNKIEYLEPTKIKLSDGFDVCENFEIITSVIDEG